MGNELSLWLLASSTSVSVSSAKVKVTCEPHQLLHQNELCSCHHWWGNYGWLIHSVLFCALKFLLLMPLYKTIKVFFFNFVRNCTACAWFPWFWWQCGGAEASQRAAMFHYGACTCHKLWQVTNSSKSQEGTLSYQGRITVFTTVFYKTDSQGKVRKQPK